MLIVQGNHGEFLPFRGGVILGEVKARPKDIISFSLDYISKSKVQTSNPSSSPISLDTPARPADLLHLYNPIEDNEVQDYNLGFHIFGLYSVFVLKFASRAKALMDYICGV